MKVSGLRYLKRVPVRWAAAATLALLACVLAFGLAACGDGGAGGSKPGEFSGRTPRDISEFSTYMEKARELGEAIDADYKEDEEAELAASVAADFKDANAAYKDGDYAKAQAGYEAILDTYARHYGANVNLVLAMLQQGKNDEALTRALACASVFKEEGGPLLNVQTAAVACGFSLNDVEKALNDEYGFEVSVLTSLDDVNDEYDYNKIWDAIEVDLGAASAEKGKGDEVAVALGNLASNLLLWLDQWGDDPDAEALQEYLVAISTQLGYPIDSDVVGADALSAIKSIAEEGQASASSASSSADSSSAASSGNASASLKEGSATSNMTPFLVADNGLFKLTVTDCGYDNGGGKVKYELENKSGSGYDMFIVAGKKWTVDNRSVEGDKNSGPVAKPGETVKGSFGFVEKGKAYTGLVSSMKGDILVKTNGEGLDGDGDIGIFSVIYEES